MPKLQIQLNGSGGLAPRFFGDKSGETSVFNRRILGGETQYADGVINPLPVLGYLVPGGSDFLTNITPNVADNIIATLVDGNDGSLYFFENNTVLYGLNGQASTALNTITTLASSRKGTDLEKYTVNGVRKIFFSYRTSTADNAGDIGIYNVTTDAVENPNWLSSACASGASLALVDHKMILADNGFMYILDGNSVHKIDGTTAGGANGTATMNVITFPVQTTRLVDSIDTRGKMWIGLVQNTTTNITAYSYAEQIGVYIWDRNSTQVNMADYIPIDGAMDFKAMFSLDGVPGCFTIGSDRYVQLRLWNGNIFEIVAEMGQEAYPRFPDSIGKIPNAIIWLGNDGYLYFYGKTALGTFNALHKIGYVLHDYSGNAGAITLSDTGTSLGVFVNFYDGVYRIRKMRPNSTTRKPNNKRFYTLVKPLPKLSTTKGITLYHLPKVGTGTSTTIDSLQVHVYFNQSNSTIATFHIKQSDGTKTFQWLPLAQRNVNWVQLGFDWNTEQSIEEGLWPIYAELELESPVKKL